LSTLLTYGNLKDLAYSLSGDSSTSPVHLASASMDTFFNASIGSLVDESECIEERMSIDLTAETGEYTLPADCVKVLRVTYADGALRPVTKQYLRSIDMTWADTTGEPALYYLDGLDGEIGLYPIPDTAAVYVGEGTSHLVVEYLASPYDLGTDDNYPEIPVWSYAGLLFGALERAFSSNTELRNIEASALYGAMAKYVARRLRIRVNGKLPRVLYHRSAPGWSPYEQDGEDGRVSDYATAATD